jgi:hypothetical protein
MEYLLSLKRFGDWLVYILALPAVTLAVRFGPAIWSWTKGKDFIEFVDSEWFNKSELKRKIESDGKEVRWGKESKLRPMAEKGWSIYIETRWFPRTRRRFAWASSKIESDPQFLFIKKKQED